MVVRPDLAATCRPHWNALETQGESAAKRALGLGNTDDPGVRNRKHEQRPLSAREAKRATSRFACPSEYSMEPEHASPTEVF